MGPKTSIALEIAATAAAMTAAAWWPWMASTSVSLPVWALPLAAVALVSAYAGVSAWRRATARRRQSRLRRQDREERMLDSIERLANALERRAGTE